MLCTKTCSQQRLFAAVPVYQHRNTQKKNSIENSTTFHKQRLHRFPSKPKKEKHCLRKIVHAVVFFSFCVVFAYLNIYSGWIFCGTKRAKVGLETKSTNIYFSLTSHSEENCLSRAAIGVCSVEWRHGKRKGVLCRFQGIIYSRQQHHIMALHILHTPWFRHLYAWLPHSVSAGQWVATEVVVYWSTFFLRIATTGEQASNRCNHVGLQSDVLVKS